MNRFFKILVLVAILTSAGCSKLMDIRNNSEKEADPIPVSIVYNDIYMTQDLADKTHSQFYQRKHSFSYFIRTYFTDGALTLRLLISSDKDFVLDQWYALPSAETENVWESFAEIEYDKGYWNEDDKLATSGRIRFTEFNQTGKLNYSGEGYCSVEGEFEITFADPEDPDKTIEITNGTFSVPESRYWDSSAMED